MKKSHILKSECEKSLAAGCPSQGEMCSVCRYRHELKLPDLPEMVFPDSELSLQHETGVGIRFVALDALKCVDTRSDPLKVAVAKKWESTRAEGLKMVKEAIKPFDWTFTTTYNGTLFSTNKDSSFKVEETSERIDYERLKQQEKIFFYDEAILYEDELADNGTSVLSVKIRVMASGFFILLRFFLRVDGVVVRLFDTRIHHQAGTDFLLREYSTKEAKLSEISLPTSILTDPNQLNERLPATQVCTQKLVIPAT